MEKSLDIITIGECLVELSTDKPFSEAEDFHLSFGGDVIASAVAAQKLGSHVGVIGSVGNDYFKDIILKELEQQGIDTSHIKICQEKNGLYLCGHTINKELITYRRKVASTCLAPEDFDADYIKSAQAVYTTGITQSLSTQSNELVKKVFEMARSNDILTAYDPNYTSSFMTVYDTKEYLEEIVENIDVLFLSLKNDAESLFELTSVEKIVKYFTDYGVKIIVIKSFSENGYFIYNNGKTEFCKFYIEKPTSHTMNAGDVFNGGFLSAIINGYSPIESAQIAAKQAGMFIERKTTLKNVPTKEEVMEL